MRAGSDIRIIVHRTASSFVLCYADHHDKAYAWMQRRRHRPGSGSPLQKCTGQEMLSWGVPTDWIEPLREAAASGAVVITMHEAKGLEFRAVAVMACDDETIPAQTRIESVGDEADLDEVYATERQLLYVACTRARDHLLITAVSPGSEFLDDLQGR